MPTRFVLKRGTPKAKTKAAKGGVQLARSPTESEKKAMEKKAEIEKVMALVKESAGGTNLSAVRQRRLSKGEGAAVAMQPRRRLSKEALEAAQINHLVAAAKEDLGVLRERRSSYERAEADAKALRDSRRGVIVDLSDGSDTDRSSSTDTAPAPTDRSTVSDPFGVLSEYHATDTAPAVAETAPAPAAALTPAPPAPTPVSAPAAASPVEESLEQKLTRILQPINNVHLSGAAARGAQAAALSRVKAASAAVGGVFLTADEWDSTRAELARLRFKNDKLTRALNEKEQQLEKQKAASPKQLQVTIAKENASPFNALRKMSSRLPMSPLARTSGNSPKSPFGLRSVNSMLMASPSA